MEEIFDLVDECDRVIGEAPRSKVHRDNLRHRAVHILAFDDAGRIWLQRRSATKDQCPRLYDSSAAGHLGRGESYGVCSIREVREEMGIDVIPRYRFKIAACPETGWEHVAVYTCRVNARVRFNEVEIESGGFFPVAGIAAWLDRAPEQFAPCFVGIFREFQRRGGNRARKHRIFTMELSRHDTPHPTLSPKGRGSDAQHAVETRAAISSPLRGRGQR